jgi:beta-glucosidase/6-phospho-beta-glucosidase/beta-galactosidase
MTKKLKTIAPSFSSKDFRWTVGIESSCIPHLGIDQYQWTQHDRYWREDFERAASDLGCRWMRYSLPWHLCEPERSVFDWRWADERVEFAREIGLKLIVDLVHFGVPAWLPEAFGDVDFPERFEIFCKAFGNHYKGKIHSVCPINEPLITCLFCGDAGLWPPHGRDLNSYVTILSRTSQALVRGIRALRETLPNVEISVCDALEYAQTQCPSDPTLPPEKCPQADVARRMLRRHVVLDLITGRINSKHKLYPWLKEHGLSSMDVNWFQKNAVTIDLLGLDYYNHTEVEIYRHIDGSYRQRTPVQPIGLYRAALDYWERYGVPLMITETSYTGTEQERIRWLESTVGDVKRLRADGIPVIGYTWWPLIDHIDWDGALLHQVGHVHPVGIYNLEKQPDQQLKRIPTALRDAYRKIMTQEEAAIGKFIPKNIPTQPQKFLFEVPVNSPLEEPMIVHCHLRWDGVWQRPQQFISRLAKKRAVLFIEGPTVIDSNESPRYTIQELADHPNILVMQTFFPSKQFSNGSWVDRERLRLLKEFLSTQKGQRFHNPIQWFYDPMAVEAFAGKLKERAIVYDCMDELSQFKFAPPEIIQRERKLLKLADLVFTGGRKLEEAKRKHHANCHFYGCGVDVEHFAKAQLPSTIVPSDLGFVEKPILGFFGVVDERMDYDLIAKLADENPEWRIVMIGPVVKVDPNSLPRRPKIYWLGSRNYSQLPLYGKAFDLCLMPFAINEATEFINPTKALEYMAMGKPVISTDVGDVYRNFGDVVKVAKNHEDFIDHCRLFLSRRIEDAVPRGLQLAQNNSWESIVGNLERHLKDVLHEKKKMKTESNREAFDYHFKSKPFQSFGAST